MGLYVTGVIGVVVFYIAVLAVGIWAATYKRKKAAQGQDDMILANRRIGPLLGVFTLIGNEYYNMHKIKPRTKIVNWNSVNTGIITGL